jgi:uncharacterized protein DUF1524/uncharacterized protein DUF262
MVANGRLTKTKLRPYFLGAIVLDQLPNSIGTVETRQIIDGQQRLTTIQVGLAAVRDLCRSRDLKEHGEAFQGLIRNTLHLSKDPDEEFKVWPTNSDRPHFRKVLSAGSIEALRNLYELAPDEREFPTLIPNAYFFFHTRMLAWVWKDGTEGAAERATALYRAIRDDLQVVVIELDENDDAQLIFETLNALGTPLLPADLVKNFLFHGAEDRGLDAEALHGQYWLHFEEDADYWRTEVRQGRLKRPRIDLFLQHYLALMTRDDVLVPHLFDTFKTYAKRDGSIRPADELASIHTYSLIYRKLSTYPHESLEGQFFYRLDQFDTSTVYPFLLELFRRLGEPGDQGAVRQVLRDLESFLVRRAICRLTTKNYNRHFLDLAKAFAEASNPSPDLVRQFLLSKGGESTEWPSDGDFRAALREAPLYRKVGRPKLRATLEAVELHLHSELSENLKIMDKLTIEHIMPQKWRENWSLPEGSGPDQEAEREAVIHRLGNLTLLTKRLNPKLSNGPWKSKRKTIAKYSRLNLNADLTSLEEWNEGSIRARGEMLTGAALEIWPRPKS